MLSGKKLLVEELSSHKFPWSFVSQWSYWYAAIQHIKNPSTNKVNWCFTKANFCLLPDTFKLKSWHHNLLSINSCQYRTGEIFDLQSNLLTLWNKGLCIMGLLSITLYLKIVYSKKPEPLQLLGIFQFILFVLIPEVALRQKMWKVSWKHLWLYRKKIVFLHLFSPGAREDSIFKINV